MNWNHVVDRMVKVKIWLVYSLKNEEGTRWYLQGARSPVQIDNESFVRAAKEIWIERGLTHEGGEVLLKNEHERRNDRDCPSTDLNSANRES